jgi:hypothetical protein
MKETHGYDELSIIYMQVVLGFKSGHVHGKCVSENNVNQKTFPNISNDIFMVDFR